MVRDNEGLPCLHQLRSCSTEGQAIVVCEEDHLFKA